MPKDNNVNEIENENEINKSSDETKGKKLSKNKRMKAGKNAYQKTRITRKQKYKLTKKNEAQINADKNEVNKSVDAKAEKNNAPINIEIQKDLPSRKQIFNGFQPQPRGAILTEEEMKRFPRTDNPVENDAPKPRGVSSNEFMKEFERKHNITPINNNEQIRPRDKHAEIQEFIKNTAVKTYKTGQTTDNASYEIGEAVVFSGNDRINTYTVKISDYESHLTKKIETESVTTEIRSELEDILRAADFEGKPVSAIAGDIHSRLSKISVSDDLIDEQGVNMHNVAVRFFKESYEVIEKADLTPKNRVIAAQSIADLMIKNYSPIAFVEGDDELDQYTDKYVVRDTDLLKDELKNLNVENVDKLLGNIESAFENDFEYDQYAVKETVVNIGNESVNTHALNMPSYNNFWIRHIENDGLTQAVRSELSNIIRAAGINENDTSALVDDIHGTLSQTVAFDNSIDRKNINMHDMAARFFKDSYAAIDKANLGPKNRIIAAQKIADLMIKNYSPLAFAKEEELGKYANKYVAENKSLLKDQLEKLNLQNVDQLVSELDSVLENGFEYDLNEPTVDPLAVENANNDENVANLDEVSDKPRIPDFYPRLEKRMDSEDIEAQVTSEITSAIKEAGITDENVAIQLANSSCSYVKREIYSIYNDVTVPETRMSQDAQTFFGKAFDSLEGAGMSKTAQIITAQKIANVMLKNYSPIAFLEEGFEQYASDYVLNNRALLKSQLEMHGLNTVDTLIDNVFAVRDGRVPLDSGDTEFEKWLNHRIDNTEIFGEVYNELSDILKNAGFTDEDKHADLVETTQYYGSRTISTYPHLDGDNPNMHDIALQFFEDSYRMIEVAGLSPKDRVITAQKISDVLLKNYSPVATEDEFSQYANNYVLGNRELLKEELEKLDVQDIDSLIGDRDIANASGPENRIPDMVNGERLREKPTDYLLNRSRNDKAFTNIRNILLDAGINEDAAESLDVGDILVDAYSEKNVPSSSISMRDVAKSVFVSTYDALRKKELAPHNKIETTQKIADVILKNYSPIIRNRALDKYANNYVINDPDLLKESLTVLNVKENENVAIGGEEEKVENVDQNAPNNVENREEPKPMSDESRVAVYTEKLKAYNNMYKLDLDSNKIVSSVTEAWDLLISGDKQKMADGEKVMKDIFKDTLKKAFDVEKGVAYDEHRLPEYAEIIKSTNELMRSAMYGFTDLYHNSNRKALFSATAFGGLNAKDIGELTTGKSLWSMDQKSDEAWDIQSKEAKNIADNWLKEDRPFEKLINEMNALVKENEKSRVDLQEAYNKLTAAEWMLINDERMMVEDPLDPLNPIPNWGNRYWKALTETREALGIPKHTSMRDLIQLDYESSAKAVENRLYNETQIFEGVLDPEDREMHDSLDMQKEQFAIQSAAAKLTNPNDKKDLNNDMTENRERHPVEELNQRKIMMNEPKNDNWILDVVTQKELTILSQANEK